MNKTCFLLAAGLLAAAAAAGAATQRAHPFDPPSAEQVGLSGAAAAQWDALRDASLQLRAAARANAQQRLATLQQLLAEPAPDLDAFSRSAEHDTDALLAQARALKARKLAFYDALPAAQQAQVRAALRDRLDRLRHLRNALTELAEAAP